MALTYRRRQPLFRLILASASPRRLTLLRSRGWQPEICPAAIDESLPADLDTNSLPDALSALALAKARAVAERMQYKAAVAEHTQHDVPTAGDVPTAVDAYTAADVPTAGDVTTAADVPTAAEGHSDSEATAIPDSTPSQTPGIILAADTVVYCDGVLGKPDSFEQAYAMLEKLKNRTHDVFTAVAFIHLPNLEEYTFTERARVRFDNYSQAAIEDYLHSAEAYDKAGAYAIQGSWGRYARVVEGDLSTVIGLPLTRVNAYLREFLHTG